MVDTVAAGVSPGTSEATDIRLRRTTTDAAGSTPPATTSRLFLARRLTQTPYNLERYTITTAEWAADVASDERADGPLVLKWALLLLLQ